MKPKIRLIVYGATENTRTENAGQSKIEGNAGMDKVKLHQTAKMEISWTGMCGTRLQG